LKAERIARVLKGSLFGQKPFRIDASPILRLRRLSGIPERSGEYWRRSQFLRLWNSAFSQLSCAQALDVAKGVRLGSVS
jgi:hypothetical protein